MIKKRKNTAKKILILVIINILFVSTANISLTAGAITHIEEKQIDVIERNEIGFSNIKLSDIRTDRVIIKFKDDIDFDKEQSFENEFLKTGIESIDELNKEYGAESVKSFFQIKEETNMQGSNPKDFDKVLENAGLKNIYELNFAEENTDILSALENYNGLSDVVEYVEPDYKVHTLDFPYPENESNLNNESWEPLPDTFPNDPGFSYQWHMQDAEHGGINVRPAWNVATGEGVTVAVIDTGVDKGSDLMQTNFVQGWDFCYDDPDPYDDNGHGTHVAGTIAQSTNNELGVCGVAYNANIMPIKALDNKGAGYVSDVADSIYFATMFGADVISMSLGTPYKSRTLKEAIEFSAGEMHVTIVAAAGNTGSPEVVYPAAYRQVISVGATQYDKTKVSYSCFGDKLDVVAPGGNLNNDQNNDTYPDGVLQQTGMLGCGWGYYYLQGTSMACPHVSGIAALLYSMGLSKYEVEERITSTTQDLGPEGWDIIYGHGLVDAYMAVQKPLKPADPQPPIREEDVDLDINISVYVEDPDHDILNVSFYCGGYSTLATDPPTNVREPFLIGEVTNVTSHNRVSIPWNNLYECGRYMWYVVVDDGEDTTQSPPFGFQTRTTHGPPYMPSNPSPEDGETNVNPNVVLSFNGGDPGLIEDVSYDLYFGTESDPSFYTNIGLYLAEQKTISYDMGLLENNTKYYWKIVSEDSTGNITEGPVWEFTTINPDDVYPTAFFTWSDVDAGGAGTIIDFDAGYSSDNNGITLYEWDFNGDGIYDDTGELVSFDFGDCENHSVTLRVTDTLGQMDTYSELVHASILPDNNPFPFFMWSDSDGNGPGTMVNLDASLSYDDNGIVLYEWDFNNDSVFDDAGELVSFDFGDYENHTVVLRVTDTVGHVNTTSRIVRAYGSDDNNPPDLPSIPDPENNALDVSVDSTLSWVGGDIDYGDAVSYDIYIGKSNPPGLLESNLMSTSYNPVDDFDYNQTYYWKVVAEDSFGVVTEGPVWEFTTKEETTDDLYPDAFFTWMDVDGDGPGSVIGFDASASSDDKGLVLYEWDFNGDGIYDDTGELVSFDFGDYSVHTVTLRVTDTIGQNDTFTCIVQSVFVENVSISFLRPESNMLYLFDIKFCSFPSTLVIGKLNIEVNITVPENMDVSKVVFFIDDVEKYNTTFDSENSVYGFCLDEKMFSKKALRVVLYNGDEAVADESMEVLFFNFLGG